MRRFDPLHLDIDLAVADIAQRGQIADRDRLDDQVLGFRRSFPVSEGRPCQVPSRPRPPGRPSLSSGCEVQMSK
ncbi:hypothetical protein [Saccharopolyspora hattusasensis]|uniref:hypothetical protein n=1 Tax=Saccharopolyspora hattusasensis TaxID=1128679 RepID=UPI003D97181C